MGLKLNFTPTKSSLSEYREKVSCDFFKEIFQSEQRRLDDSRLKFRGYYVYAMDGDHLDLPASQGVFKHGYRGWPVHSAKETHYPKMYTVQVMDIVNGIVRDFSYAREVSEVAMALEMVEKLETNSITIYDRLYCRYSTALAHLNAGNHFLVRVITRGPKLHHQMRKFCESKRRESSIMLQPKREMQKRGFKPIPVRLIKVKSRKTKQDIVFMTNLLPAVIKNKEIDKLYQRRWEVETNFRDLTSTLKMGRWHSTKLNGILQEIYALLWLVNVVRHQCTRFTLQAQRWLEDKYKKPNFKLCIGLVMDNLDLLLQHKHAKLMKILKF